MAAGAIKAVIGKVLKSKAFKSILKSGSSKGDSGFLPKTPDMINILDNGFYGHYDPTKVVKVNSSGGSKPISKIKLDGTAWGKAALTQVRKRSK